MTRKPAILATVCLAVLTINLDTTIVNVALPSFATELDASTRDLLWIVDGYNLSFAALVLAMGSVSDRFGRRPALLAGLAGFALSSVAAAMVDSSGALVALRFVMGTSAALIFPTTLSIISNAFTERRERAAALGLWGAAVGVGVAAGPVAGGWLLGHYSWPSVFWALVPVALITIAMTLAFVPESRDPAVPPLDKTGLVVSVAMLGLLTFTIIEAPDHGWLSARTLVGFAASLVLLLVFVRVERAAAHPMLDVQLFTDRQVQRRVRRGDGRVLRALRVHLPDHAVLPVRPRLLPARHRPAHPAGRRQHRGGLGHRWVPGAADRHQGRGRHRPRDARVVVPVDLHLGGHHVVPRGDRAADAADGPRASAWSPRRRPSRSSRCCRPPGPGSGPRSTTPPASSAAPSASP